MSNGIDESKGSGITGTGAHLAIGALGIGLFLGFGFGYKFGTERISRSLGSELAKIEAKLSKAQDEFKATNSSLSQTQHEGKQIQSDLNTASWKLAEVERSLSQALSDLIVLRGEAKARQGELAQSEQKASVLEKRLNAILDRFITKEVNITFRQQLGEFQSTGIGRLEVGTLDSVVTVNRSEKKSTAWEWLPLGTAVAELKVPVTYRFQLDLAAAWDISITDHNCVVRPPKLMPSLPVAIHTDKLEKYSSNAWSSFDVGTLSDKLERTLTPTANENAIMLSSSDAVKNPAREVVAKFVRNWLIGAGGWSEEKVNAITVIFADEAVSDAALPATLSFDPKELQDKVRRIPTN